MYLCSSLRIEDSNIYSNKIEGFLDLSLSIYPGKSGIYVTYMLHCVVYVTPRYVVCKCYEPMYIDITLIRPYIFEYMCNMCEI